MVQNRQKGVSSGDLDSLPIPVPPVIASQCLIALFFLAYLLLFGPALLSWSLTFLSVEVASSLGQALPSLRSTCVSQQSTCSAIPLLSVGERDTSE